MQSIIMNAQDFQVHLVVDTYSTFYKVAFKELTIAAQFAVLLCGGNFWEVI